jgi:quinol monooxygenase YgiN
MSDSDTWYEDDIVVTIVPKFKIKDGMKEQYMALLPKFVKLVKENEAESCVHYGFVGPTEDDFVICREGYVSGQAVLNHLGNIGDVLNEALQYADIVDLMVQGPAAELEKLKEPLADFGPAYYPLVEGSLRSKKIW